MNPTLSALYSKVMSAFYGAGGVSRLSRFLDAFEKASKEEFDRAVNEALKESK